MKILSSHNISLLAEAIYTLAFISQDHLFLVENNFCYELPIELLKMAAVLKYSPSVVNLYHI